MDVQPAEVKSLMELNDDCIMEILQVLAFISLNNVSLVWMTCMFCRVSIEYKKCTL